MYFHFLQELQEINSEIEYILENLQEGYEFKVKNIENNSDIKMQSLQEKRCQKDSIR